MYLFYKTRGESPAPVELLRWQIAERYGWSLEYIDNLSMADIHEYLQIQDAKAKL